MEALREMIDSVPQRGLLLARHLTTSTLAAVVFGVTGGMLGVKLAPMKLGPVAPYLACSAAGFALASYSFWQDECQQAVSSVRNFPKLMVHHLRVGHPQYIDGVAKQYRIGPKFGSSGEEQDAEDENTGDDDEDCATVDEIVELMQKDRALMTWFILARQTAASDINDLHRRRADALIDEGSP